MVVGQLHDALKGVVDVVWCGGRADGAQCTAYRVGTYNELEKLSVSGGELDLHHLPQADAAGQAVCGYDRGDTSGIALPKYEHKSIPTQSRSVCWDADGFDKQRSG